MRGEGGEWEICHPEGGHRAWEDRLHCHRVSEGGREGEWEICHPEGGDRAWEDRLHCHRVSEGGGRGSGRYVTLREGIGHGRTTYTVTG